MHTPRLTVALFSMMCLLAACRGEPSPTAQPSQAPLTQGPRLVYLWPANGAADLYLLDPFSGDVQRLTEGMNVFEFSIVADGQAIYFSAGNAEGGSDLFRQNVSANAQVERILACFRAACRDPQVSADGLWLAYEYLEETSDGALEPVHVLLAPLGGGMATLMGNPQHETLLPSWSSSGLLAYYDRDGQAFLIYDPQTKEVVRLPNQTGEAGSWSPDGRFYLASEISFVSVGESQDVGASHLLRYTISNGASIDLSKLYDVEDATPVYSPDGQWIAFGRKSLDPALWTQGRQLWLMGADGNQPRQITDDAVYQHYDFTWSADGRYLAYMRFNQVEWNEPPELWMVEEVKGEAVQLVIGGYAPQWLP
ncbi:MAG: PD40 domain-containing protein [Anaerolineales bacterium]|nr:PD40 domain-containing protein [Anaerolineales bacterium]